MNVRKPQGSGVLRRLRGTRGDESGMALVLVVGSMLVLAMLAMTALAFSIQSQKFARYSQDYTGAMAAAQSGIEDLISRLNREDVYADSIDCTNIALRGPMSPTSNGCGWSMSTAAGWMPVEPGETDPAAAHFHYSIDGSLSQSEGSVKIRSTGRVNGEYRTIEAVVGKGGSTDYVYYTDFESGDPSNVQIYKPGSSSPASKPAGGASLTQCGSNGHATALHWWEGRSSYACAEITFGGSDELDGAVFSNDSVWSASAYGGATFLDGFKSANPGCNSVTASTSTWNSCLRNTGGASSTANFNGIRPAYSQLYYLDDTSAAFATYPGCHYYGATRVIFNSSGTMTVWNKTVNNGGQAPVAIPGPTGVTPTCGTVSSLNDPAGATVNVPDKLVLYVGAAPAAATRVQCNAGEIGGPTGRTLPLGTYDRTVHRTSGSSHPTYSYDENMAETTKTCQEGNLYLEGVLNGRVTAAAAQSIIVTGDVVLAGGRNGDDILGLVATNSVEVMHARLRDYSWQYTNASCAAVGSGGSYKYCPTGTASEVSGWPRRYADPTTGANNPTNGLQIAGSIQTLQHSFLVQKYDVGGDKGTLNVFGSIAQRWRGAVGTSGGQGYDKLYQYDRRLIFGPPPYFPRWTNAQWSLRYSGEVNTPTGIKG